MRIKVYFDFIDDSLKPTVMTIRFKRGFIQWDKTRLVVPLEAPAERLHAEDFADDVVNAIVLLEDLVTLSDRSQAFGVHLAGIRERYMKTGLLDEIEQFVIRISDIEELLEIKLQEQYNWGNAL